MKSILQKPHLFALSATAFFTWLVLSMFLSLQEKNNDVKSMGNAMPLAGIYTIGADPADDYVDIPAALSDLYALGISDTTRFLIRYDTLSLNENLSPIVGANCNTPVIFETDPSFTEKTVLRGASNNIVFTMNAAVGLQFNNLRFVLANDLNTAILINFTSGSSCNKISNCVFTGSDNGSVFSRIINCSGSAIADNEFIDNEFYKGYNGIYILGTNGSSVERMRIQGNEFFNFTGRGMEFRLVDSTEIADNQFYFGTASVAMQLIDVNNSNVINNFISQNDTGNWLTSGIYQSSCAQNLVSHNTIRMQSADPFAYAFRDLSGFDNDIANNIFYNEGAGPAVVLTSVSQDTSQYNALYTNGDFLGYYDSNSAADIATWQAITPSVGIAAVDPVLLFDTDIPYKAYGDQLNTTLDVGVEKDIEGKMRTQPGIRGALEFFNPNLNFGAHEINVNRPFPAGAHSGTIAWINYGLSSVTDVDYTVRLDPLNSSLPSVDSVLQHNLNTPAAFGDTVVLPFEFNFAANEWYNVYGWIDALDGMVDGDATNDTVFLDSLHTALSGTYTVGPSGQDFPDLDSVFLVLDKAGYLGNTTFSLFADTLTFSGAVEVPSLNSNTLKFENGDTQSNPPVIHSGNANSNNIITANNAQLWYFENLNFQAFDPAGSGNLIEFNGSSALNNFTNCNFTGVDGGMGDQQYLIKGSGDWIGEFQWTGNTFNYGSYAIHLNSNNPINDINGFCSSNNFVNQTEGGLFLKNSIGSRIFSNSFESTYPYIALQLEEMDFTEVNANSIVSQESGVGIQSNMGSQNEITNNLIHQNKDSSLVFQAIQLSDENNSKILHNTIRLKNTDATAFCLKVESGTGNVIFNNIFSNEGRGKVISFASSAAVDSCDYNLYFTAGDVLVQEQGNSWETLNDWKNSSPNYNTSSHFFNPGFSTQDTMLTTNEVIDGVGHGTSVSADHNNAVRSNPPDIGAFEFSPLQHNLQLAEILYPDSLFDAGLQTIGIVVQLIGDATFLTADLDVEFNCLTNPSNSVDTAIELYGDPPNFPAPAFQDTFWFDLPFVLKNDYRIKAFTSNPNGMPDMEPGNDTLETAIIHPSVSGEFLVGVHPNYAQDFATIEEALTCLSEEGISDTTVLYLTDSLYLLNNILQIDNYEGMSCDRTIFIVPAITNPLRPIIRTDDASSVVRLVDADGLYFDHLEFQNFRNSSFANVLQLLGSSDCNTFHDCHFRRVPTTSGFSTAASVIAEPLNFTNGLEANPLNNTFAGCEFIHGSYGIYLESQNLPNNWILDGNQIDSMAAEGIYMYRAHGMNISNQSISNCPVGIHANEADTLFLFNNDISAEDLGIHLERGKNHQVWSNRVVADWGIFTLGQTFDRQDSTELLNNMLICAERGIVQHDSRYQTIAFNSIKIENPNGPGEEAYHNAGGNTFVDLLNNIFVNASGGTAMSDISGSSLLCDYNDIYSTGNFIIPGYATLADWQATGFDANSISANPYFLDSLDLHIDNMLANCVISPVSGIALDTISDFDYDGHPRLIPSDIGADDFTPIVMGCDDGDPCTANLCDEVTGLCIFPPINNPGCPCDDNNLCTINDVYNSNGICTGTPLDCDDGNPCTDDACNPATGICEYVNNTAPCSDGSACTIGDHCNGGTCVPGTTLDCDDGLPCTDDSCDPLLGCINTPVLDGTVCDDGSLCTTNTVCMGGVCVGPSIDCDDGNPCTLNDCDPLIGCINTPQPGAPCDDGDPCTINDTCDGAGMCMGVNTCGPCQGMPAGTACDDGDPCTQNDVCDGAGNCMGTMVNCDDGDPCTLDNCTANGCENIPIPNTTQLVTAKVDNVPGSLRAVIAIACPGDTIAFHPSLSSSVIQITSGRITLNKDLHFHGLGDTPISAFSTSQHFYIAPGTAIWIQDIHLINGHAPMNGGALENDGTLHLQNMSFINNTEGAGIPKPLTNHGTLIIGDGVVEVE